MHAPAITYYSETLSRVILVRCDSIFLKINCYKF